MEQGDSHAPQTKQGRADVCSESVSGELVKAGVDCLDEGARLLPGGFRHARGGFTPRVDEGERSASLRGPAKFTKTVALKRLFHGIAFTSTYLLRNCCRRVWSMSCCMFWRVKTFPCVAMSSFFMSSRRTPKPRPAMQATTSNFG